jgi:Trk-type K+ transport system membrane component
MDDTGLSALIILGAIGFIWLLPVLIIVSSGKTTGGEKLAWILAVVFISWFAWVFYMLLAPIKSKKVR